MGRHNQLFMVYRVARSGWVQQTFEVMANLRVACVWLAHDLYIEHDVNFLPSVFGVSLRSVLSSSTISTFHPPYHHERVSRLRSLVLGQRY